ncbi:MAG TPA: magnesium transporter CorA family protein [Kineosporiaceae bacterium]|nr:magnesium transporter CorA family protein [Kineosporiaceae bacterium]
MSEQVPPPHTGTRSTDRRIRSRLYRHGVLVAEDFPVADVSDHLGDPDAVVWVDFCAPTPEDFEQIAEELDLHDLAVEDALKAQQRPKLDRYATHLFVTAYQVALDTSTGQLDTSGVAAFITPQALVTVHPRPQFAIDEVVRRWDTAEDQAKYGISFLLYGLLDHVVDSHFQAVHVLDGEIERLEDLLFEDNPQDGVVQRRSFRLRKSLVLLRRVTLPMREVVNALMRRDLQIMDSAMLPYYQDVYDHVLRATEWTESLRDLVTTILETNLTIQGNRLNTIMKKVTSWAAIIAVPTAITGYYGQNVPYPGFGSAVGFWTSTGAIVVLSGLLYVVFRRRDWL